VTFGDPLTAGVAVFNPNASLVESQSFTGVGATIPPVGQGDIDVSAFQSLIMYLEGDAVTTVVCELEWRFGPGTILNPDIVPAGGVPPVNRSFAAGPAGPLVVQFPVLAPFVKIANTLIIGAGGQSVSLFGSGVYWPAVRTPGAEGFPIASVANALGVGGNNTTAFPLEYCGPAKLFVRGDGGAWCSAFITNRAGTPIHGTQVVVPAAGNLGTDSVGEVDVWIPPEACSLVTINGGTAQTVRAVVTATAP
jgi:hypothetical protein